MLGLPYPGRIARASFPACCLVVLPLLLPPLARAQGTSGPTTSDSKVGYIDNAIPGTLLRLRADAAYNNRRPSRAEFFYAQTAPGGPGLRATERSVDYQDVAAYGEVAFDQRFSVFLDVPTRFLNPDVNSDSAGLSDLNAGFKFALLRNDDSVTSFQFRTFAPTGDAERGLGTRHASLEPALLSYHALSDRLELESELRYWVPVGGTDFAGNVIRYGVGLGYDLFQGSACRVTPVVEFVGWTVLSGKAKFAFPSGQPAVEDASGDTILNFKLGLRTRMGENADIYAGYGRPLTGDRWYENTMRLEFRLSY